MSTLEGSVCDSSGLPRRTASSPRCRCPPGAPIRPSRCTGSASPPRRRAAPHACGWRRRNRTRARPARLWRRRMRTPRTAVRRARDRDHSDAAASTFKTKKPADKCGSLRFLDAIASRLESVSAVFYVHAKALAALKNPYKKHDPLPAQ